MKTPFSPFPVLTTERLILRQLHIKDAPKLAAMRSDARVNEFLDRADTITIEDAEKYIAKIDKNIEENSSIAWTMTLKPTDELIGMICLWNIKPDISCMELGYEMLPDFHGRGYMLEAAKAVIEFGFNKMELETIVACPHKDNQPSKKLLERTGFTRTPELDEKEEPNLVFYSLKRKS